ncbi:hypothetical protein QZH41_015070 [Actinostola sp. cb2023]|nr:hypothetical protein QZH41_015070 [Actinostola sp. cb2023]
MQKTPEIGDSKWIDACYRESCEQVQLVSDMTIQRLLVELETGGNVRFEDGKPPDVWYKSCHDLVTSRFCAGDYLNHGITGIKIHRITRVHNRILRTNFDEALDEKLDQDDIMNITKGRSHKKLLEYLFFMWNPNILDEANEPITVLEKGFRKCYEYENAGQDGGIPLSNSVGVCDESRIQYCTKKSKERGSTNPCPFRHGQLIVAKVFVGKAVIANVGERRVTKSRYPGVDSVFRPRSHGDSEPKTILGITKPVKPCDCSSRQCAWFVFDESMVLPEYVVDFEYITKVKSKSPCIHYSGDVTTPKDSTGNDTSTVDDDVLNIEPKAKPRPRLIALTEELLLSHSNVDSLQNITVLNLHGNGLTRLKYINTIVQLKKLIVSFNELIKLDEINHMSTWMLVFNKLTTLEGIKGCNRLKYLDISWNKLRYTREELGIMRKTHDNLGIVVGVTSYVASICLCVTMLDTLRMRALGRLKNLEVLDGKPVMADEVATSLRMAAASRISTFAILAHSRTNQVKPHSLSLFPTAQTILATSNQKPARPMDDDNQWMVKVTTLNLDNLHLGKISNLEKLVNLRWASLNNNDLTKIEGFDCCTLLEELSLEGNCISKFEGLSRNSKLQWLNIRHNNLSNLDTGMLERLPELCHLSIENNCIRSLRGLQHCVLEIQELYIGNNDISNIREIFTLKLIAQQIIDFCDLSFDNTKSTGWSGCDISHLYLYLQEPSEGGVAKDTFGGRMTTDFIAERLGHSNFMELRELDFPNCSLRTVDLGSGELFLNLRR